MDKFFQTLENELKNSNLTKEQKAALIKNACELYRQKIDKDYQKYVRNQRIGAGIEIASAAIPASIGVKTASKIAPTVIKKTVGRKFTNDITAGAINSAMSGGIYGLGESVAENKNPIINSSKRATENLIVGGLISAPISKVQNTINAKEVLSINAMRGKDGWGIAYRKASGNPQKAIETLKENQNGFVPNAFHHKDLGNIDLVWGNKKSGLKHIIERRNSQGIDGIDFVNNLPNVINNGNLYEKAGHIDRKYIGDGISEVSVKTNYILPNQKVIERQWIPSAYKLYDNSTKNSQAAPVVQTLGTIAPTNRVPLSDLRINNIINDNFNKNNPPKWVNSQTATLGQIINNNTQENIHDLDVDTVITSRGKGSQTKNFDKIFTIDDIEKMPPEEFAKNEQLILEQVQQGSIAPATQRKTNFSGYVNPVSNDTKIFTQEDIGDLTGDEFSELEKEIRGQLETIGIPTTNELQNSDVIYIAPYTRHDGVYVRGHFRSK